MDKIFDLLGDPIPQGRGKRGRPEHIPTGINRSQVRLLLAMNWTEPRIANALRITTPTLRKHYFSELKERAAARDALQAARLLMVYKAAAAGNVGAMKELGRIVDNDELAGVGRARSDQDEEIVDRLQGLGKKDRANIEAETGLAGTRWGQLLRPH